MKRLEAANIRNAEREVIWLACHALGISEAEFFTRESFSHSEISRIDELITRRESHEPLQYIISEADFFGRDFRVGSGVLIPRHDTEVLVEAALEIFRGKSGVKFLDWGTGSGCIGLTLLLELGDSFAYLLEASSAAMSYARENVARYNLESRVKFSYPENSESLDLIISNPPYIPTREICELMPEVRDFEPISALDGGVDGMDFYRLIFSDTCGFLKHGGYVILEIGDLNQYHEISSLQNFSNGFRFVREFYDFGNFPRCVLCQKLL